MHSADLDVTTPAERGSSPDRVVRALVVTEFIQGLAASAVLPMLPLFVRRTGASDTLVGIVMAAFFVAGVLTPYLAGFCADRLGHRRVIVAGLVGYAVASVVFVAPIGAGGYIGCRAVQGVGAGAVQVAGLALVGVVVPAGRRGRAFAAVFAAELLGMAVGPLVGSIAGVGHLRAVFLATAAASLVATAPVLRGTPAQVLAEHAHAVPLVVTRGLTGVLMLGVAGGFIVGVYETCWTLLMTSRGAAAWQVGLSWTLFAAPFAAFSPVAGRITDRFDRRWLAVGAMVVSAGFAATYPFIPKVALLIGLGTLEAVGVAVSMPATQSLLAQTTVAGALGRAQGLFGTAQIAAMAVAAGASGYLFSVSRAVPFVSAAALAAALALATPLLWRSVPGHFGRISLDAEVPVPASGDSGLSVGATVRP